MAIRKDKLKEWFADIRKGDLYCPFEQCTWTFFTSFELADHLFEDCEFGRYNDNVPCTHCNYRLKSEDLKHHWRIRHKDEVSILAFLDKGLQTTCPNYLCSEIFCGNREGCKDYLKHSISCHPLFLCHKCKGEYSSKLILHQHLPICKGELKRDINKSISKVEVQVDRDISKRPKLNGKLERLHIEKWRKAIKSANFCCPVPSCTKKYFFPNHFVQHLTMEAKVDSIFNRIDVVECPFCNSITNWSLLGRHLNDYHRDIMKMLNMLRKGKDMICPNYKCTTKEVFTSKTGFEYLQHAVNCRPLYQCKYCEIEIKHESYLKKHIVKCKEKSNVSNEVSLNEYSELQTTQDYVDNSCSDEISTKISLSTEELNEPSTIVLDRKSDKQSAINKNVVKSTCVSPSRIEKLERKNKSVSVMKLIHCEKLRIEWKSKIGKGIFGCGCAECLEVFISPELMINHMEVCNIDDANEYILKTDKLHCLWCKQDIDIKNFKDHVDQQHSMIVEVLPSKTDNYTCPNYGCNTICDNHEEFLQHCVQCETCISYVDCKVTFTSEEDSNNHDCVAKDKIFCKVTLIDVIQAIHHRNFDCPFAGCPFTYVICYELAEHMQGDCSFGSFKGKIPCTHCNISLPADDLKHHWRSTHKDVNSMLHTLKSGTRSKCLNYLCKVYFNGNTSGCKEYMKHSHQCEPLFACTVCHKEYIRSIHLRQHVCSGKRSMEKSISKNEMFINRDMAKRPKLNARTEVLHIEEWKKAVKSGNFCCPVPSCTKQFFYPTHFINHLRKEAKVDSIFNGIDIVECPFCGTVTNWSLLGRHLNGYHRDVTKMLNMLRKGYDMICPNYKCTTKEVFTCDTGIEYLQHAVSCQPLYQCKNCGTERKQESYLKKHMATCR